mmetsp:Transcript_23199/g.50718  ORF Transcript_23199/g.50718 Transcript_23199/m.50718 type:complete len:622 (+) Transcript_23199:64-1929(+)
MPFLRNPSASAITAASLAKTSRRLLGSSSSSQLTTTTTTTTATAKSTRTGSRTTTLSRYGLGGQHWRQFNPESYQELIYQSLSKKVSHFEVAGQEGGGIAMTGAIQSALERNPDFLSSPVTITVRLGYRSLIGNTGANTADEDEQAAAAAAATPGENQPMLGDVMLSQPPEEGKSGTSNRAVAYDTPDNVVHNISSEYLLQAVRSSPLLELRDIMENLRLVFLLHNPEVQVVDLLQEDPRATPEAQQEFIRQRWTPAMETLQEYSCNNSSSSSNGVSFGVCSNGLGIPKADNHPMHLDTNSVVQAAKTYDRFSTIQLPANLLETYGWEMARKIKAETQLDVLAMRPLTCYPDLGTGSGYPFRLVDYSLPTLQDDGNSDGLNNNNDTDTTQQHGDSNGAGTSSLRYTNEIAGIPTIYQMTLQAAMSHFDAEELLELKQERELSMEERETLDGCKLMQSMIHDLDNQLADIRSFAAHEDELYGRIIPLIHDTFELMDDTTSDVLQAYFAAYAVAVRYAIATKTREVLKGGEMGNQGSVSTTTTGITYPDIPQSMTLQEYALRHMLAEKCFDRIVIGASTMQDFDHQTQLMDAIDSGEEHPLEELLSIPEPEEETIGDGKNEQQ